MHHTVSPPIPTNNIISLPLHDNEENEPSRVILPVQPPYAFHIYLCAPSKQLHQAFVAAFEAYESLRQASGPDRENPRLTYSVHNTRLEKLLPNREVDCIVSPANGFGLMDGGVDYYISEWYGGAVDFIPYVQRNIEEEWAGQQNVGTSFIVDLAPFIKRNPPKQPRNLPRYLAHIPTMRTPKKLDPSDDIVYRCMWALLASVARHNKHAHQTPNLSTPIRSILVFGFGAGVGELEPENVAKQMALATKHFVEAPSNGNPGTDAGFEGYHRTWDYAHIIEKDIEKLYGDNSPDKK